MAERRLPPQSHYAKTTVTVVIVLALLAAAWAVRSVLILVLVSAVLAIGLDQPVRRLERWRFSRGLAVASIFLVAFLALAAFAILVIPPVVTEALDFLNDLPERLREAEAEDQPGLFGFLERQFDLSDRIEEFSRRLPQRAGESFGTLINVAGDVGIFIFNLLTIAILTIYFLLSMPRAKLTAVEMFPPARRVQARQLLAESLEKVGRYVSGNIIISLIAGGASFIFLTAIGVPFAPAVAMWVAIADLIPTVGATLGALVAVVAALFSTTGDLIATIVFFVVYQQIENYVIAPRVMKHAVDLSPAAVIIAVLIGGSLFGFSGALIALPVAAVAKVVMRDMWLRDRVGARTPGGKETVPAVEPPEKE
jgi:predicted PurR-regulated permease PerM